MRRASLYNTFSASLLLVCNACLSSCVSQIPLTKEKPVNNSTYQVEYLFEHEGCKVYRFRDMGHYIYFTNCEGDVTSIESDSVRTVNRISRKPIIIKEADTRLGLYGYSVFHKDRFRIGQTFCRKRFHTFQLIVQALRLIFVSSHCMIRQKFGFLDHVI